MNSVVDPVDAISSSKKPVAQSGGTHSIQVDNQNGDSDYLFSSNYIIAVMKLTDLAMQHQSDVVKLRSQLADTVTRIQSDLSVINQYASTIENQSNAAGLCGGSYYNVDTSKHIEYPSSSFSSSTSAFINAVKDLFVSTPASAGDLTVADISKIDGPYGQTFDLSSSKTPGNWTAIQSEFSAKFPALDPIINPDPTLHPSLIQQYIYYSAQLSVNTCSKEDLIAAGGDITKVPGVNFNPLDQTFDPTLNAILGVFTNLNITTAYDGNWNNCQVHQSSIFDQAVLGETTTTVNGNQGLYSSFNVLAYDYYFTKNPSASGCPSSLPGDPLSAIYSSSSSAQSTVSSSSSTTNTNFQQDTSSVQTINNSAQQMIQNFTQGQGSTIQNFKV